MQKYTGDNSLQGLQSRHFGHFWPVLAHFSCFWPLCGPSSTSLPAYFWFIQLSKSNGRPRATIWPIWISLKKIVPQVEKMRFSCLNNFDGASTDFDLINILDRSG
jgi:hypothetical protein